MTNKFPAFAKTVTTSFQTVVRAPQVYVTGIDGDALYQRYLAAFPEGTNPLFKKQTEHECSCCKHFIRRAGNVVSVNDQGLIRTIWDEAVEKAPHPYNTVASALRAAVLSADISDLYRVSQKESSHALGRRRWHGADLESPLHGRDPQGTAGRVA
jgi:hypothetical protein